jgi:hypothetical protein
LRRFNTLFKDKKEKEDIYKRKEEGKPLPLLLSFPPPLTSSSWPDLFTGVFIYPMLIVFIAEHAACLKHSSLFKVKV